MAFVRGKDAKVWTKDSGGTARDLTSYCDSIDYTLDSEVLDTTTFATDYKSSIRGFLSFSGSLKGKYDNAGTGVPDEWFFSLINAAATVASEITIAPSGSATGRPYMRANVFYNGYKAAVPVDNVVTWEVGFQLATGSVTRGTF